MATNRTIGLFLVLVGLALLGSTLLGFGGELILPLLGLAFLAGYVSRGSYGLLIPGAILTGLGIGVVAESAGAPDGVVVVGLGLGFLGIAVADRRTVPERAGWWWPLIPGGILTLTGIGDLTGIRDAGRYVVPLGLILVGGWLLLHRAPSAPATPARTSAGTPEPERQAPVGAPRPGRSDEAVPPPPPPADPAEPSPR